MNYIVQVFGDADMARLFIAIDITDKDIIKNAIRVQDLIRSWNIRATYPSPDQLHITLKFLGELDESVIPKIINSLSPIKHKKFKIKFGFVGGFPSIKRPRVIFVGAEESAELSRLQRAIEAKLFFLGKKENRPFHPHVTVARIKSLYKWNNKIISELEKIKMDLEYDINNFKLKRSILKSTGPEYIDLHIFNLV